jgi:hypothetical protein
MQATCRLNLKARLPFAVMTMWLSTCSASYAANETPAAHSEPVPVIHLTDLFRPHNDPDDHWDLACAYALAHQGRIDLQGILIDYPQPERRSDPDVLAVAQMNYLTGLAVPVMIGSPRWYKPEEASTPDGQRDLGGVWAMLDIMRRSRRPVVIHVLGSCRDVAIAGQLEPRLFAQKCRAVYLNAGSGTPDPEKARRLEWNVHLDPQAYTAVFDLPCPVYWMPCFQEVPQAGQPFQVARHGTFYRFRQGDVLPHLSQNVRNYFAYMFRHGRSAPDRQASQTRQTDWLRALHSPPSPRLRETIHQMDRNMWCTGGFLHAAGWTVTCAGDIVRLERAAEPVFTFQPVDVEFRQQAVTHWRSTAAAATDRFMFQVQDVDRYSAAMTAALRSLLETLP